MSSLFPSIRIKQLLCHEGLFYCQQSKQRYSEGFDLAHHEKALLANQFARRWSALPAKDSQFVIGETRFKAGITFLLSWQQWLKHAPATASLYYIASESEPLTKSSLKHFLSQWPELTRETEQLIEVYPVLTPGYHLLSFEKGRVNLLLMLGNNADCFQQLLACGDFQFEKHIRPYHVDAWFFHEVHETKTLLPSLIMLSKAESTFASIHQAANEEEALLEEINKAIKGEKTLTYKKRVSPWHLSANRESFSSRRALVIGAGIAGSFMANRLALHGWHVTIVDESAGPGEGASGNPQALFYPLLSAFDSPFTAFMLSAFLHAERVYRTLLKNDPNLGELTGIVQLLSKHQKQKEEDCVAQWIQQYQDLGVFVTAEETMDLVGYPLDNDAIFLPTAGWLNGKALCQRLIEHERIQCHFNQSIAQLNRDAELWHCDDKFHADILIISTGFKANHFSQSTFFPLKTLAGQITEIPANERSAQIKYPLCKEGHVLPARHNKHFIGASFRPLTEKQSCSLDDEQNFAKASSIVDIFTHEVTGQWYGVRGASLDHLPLVGPVPIESVFLKSFEALKTDAKRWLPVTGDYYPGLFLLTGLGARGLTTAALCADYLCSLIHHYPVLPQRLARALSPARFLIKGLTHPRK